MIKRISTALSASLVCASLAFATSATANIQPATEVLESKRSLSAHFLDEVPMHRIPSDLMPGEVWVRIDLHQRQLFIYQEEDVISTVPHVAIGENGASWVRLRGSKVTPLGEFRIERINPQSQFYRFYGIDYPNEEVADRALAQGVIDSSEHQAIKTYRAKHGRAPTHTSLGGNIGIHGLGHRDAYLHEIVDWTLGCLATNNFEIDQIAPWLGVGTRIRIDV